jgi:putative intracellular protease/amidase
MPSVLMVLSGAKVWTMKDGTPHPTGFWAREFVEAHQVFTKAGMEVTIATPQGVAPTVDPLSLALPYNDNSADEVAQQQAYIAANAAALNAPARLEDMRAEDFDIVFIVGGHGPMQDLAVHPTLGDLLAAMLDDPNKVVSSVCHGAAGFLSAHRADGTWLFRGRKVTCFTNEEENMATFAGNAAWLLEDRLRLAGAIFDAAPAYTPHAVVDGNLVTGQQNVSAGVAAEAILKQMKITA